MTHPINRRKFFSQSSAAAGLMMATSSAVFAAAKSDSGSGPIVSTASGKLRGAVLSGAQAKVKAFKGVPYGASTEGARFLPPSKVQPWTGVRDALELAPASPQNRSNLIPESMAQSPTSDNTGNEDCLHLNVWSQSISSNGKRPVMVWFHGGGYSAGSANWNMYDGANLAAKHDVVVVGVNSRLNVFGYLHLADLGEAKYAQASNVGMLDIVQALEWVRDNIANFGGDPNNVTIFGQSGGGGKVSTLMGFIPAKGLFHRAIAMSGSNVNGITRDRANQGVEAYLKTLGLGKGDIDKLQTMPIAQLLKAMQETRGLNLGPVIDGRTMPAGPFNPVASELSATVPLMIGSTETEITWSNTIKLDPLDDAGLHARVKEYAKVDDAATDRLIAAYKKGFPKADNLSLALILGTDVSNFRTGTDTEAERKAMAGKSPVYKYYFQWYSPVRGGAIRSYHTLDIPFVFQNTTITESMNGNNTKELQPLSDKMSAAFVAFARTGVPNSKLTPKWEPFTLSNNGKNRGTMIFNNECRFANDPFKQQREARIAEKAMGAPA